MLISISVLSYMDSCKDGLYKINKYKSFITQMDIAMYF